MKNNVNVDISSAESEFLEKLQKIVDETIKEEDLVINNLIHPAKDELTPVQKISDKVARFGGSWKFIIAFIIFMVFWVTINTAAVASKPFDPYPFILMNLVLSCIAALQAPIIMMSQNRQEEKDRMRSENDYLINLKAEMGIRSLQQKMDLLLGEQIKQLYDLQAIEIELLKQLHEKNKAKKGE
ncbi:DUF1003 domain-containing protein [Pedobacter sp.]|uniref:DUF1003 domain-containing protein n=1 Tax=Pedobacter sp. TaxID=1411316 RepID=UPI003D7FA310